MNSKLITMNISLPETFRSWIEKCLKVDGFGTVSEYFRSLIREDQKRRAREELDNKLLEALDSGEATEMTKNDWNQIRSKIKKRLQLTK